MCRINCSGGCPDCSPEDHPRYRELLLEERIAHEGYQASEAYYGTIEEWEKHNKQNFMTFYIKRMNP